LITFTVIRISRVLITILFFKGVATIADEFV